MLSKKKLLLALVCVLVCSGVAIAALCSTGQQLYSKHQESLANLSTASIEKDRAKIAMDDAYAAYTAWQLAVVNHLQIHGGCVPETCPTMQSLQQSLGAAYNTWQSKVADYQLWSNVYDAMKAIAQMDFNAWTNHRYACSICP